MKTMKIKTIKPLLAAVLMASLVGSCKQEVIKLQQPVTPTPETPSKGNADFTKFVAIGNSLTAGFQAGALFTEGQNNSLPKILSTQFALVGGGAFNQPDIVSVNGYSSSTAVSCYYLGRFILFYSDGPAGPRTPAPYPAHYPGASVTCPSSVVTPPLPAPYNTADKPTAFTGDTSALNTFGVPGILLGPTPDRNP